MTYTEDEQTSTDWFIPPVESDDVDQEASIFEWETGKKPSKRIIRQKLEGERGTTTVFFGDYDQTGLNEAKDPWANSKVPVEVIEYIVEFALEQSEYLQGLIFQFLDTKDDTVLAKISETLDFFGNHDTPHQKRQVANTKVSISDIIRKNLPLSLDEIVALVSQVSPHTKRPAATARQFLRDNLDRGWVQQDKGGFYHDTRP